MTLNKLTNDIQPLSEVDKINEIIDTVNSINIPSVGNGIVSFTQNGQQKGSFSANQSSNTTIDFDLSSRNIGEIVASTIPLTDAGLHLLDGTLISGSGVYSAFVTYIAGLRTQYSSLFTTESDWQSAVTQYGVCGKFVYNSTNNTVRLPKITGIIEGTTDVVALGDLVEAGLPNITGTLNWLASSSAGRYSSATQAFSKSTISNTKDFGNGTYSTRGTVNFDASDSNSIYGNSTTVQPQTIKVLYYIVIGTSVKTDIQVDIDNIATDLNGKADIDLTNTTNQAKILMSGMGMPSDAYVNLTLGASGSTYTAPANGWFYISKKATANAQWGEIINTTNGMTSNAAYVGNGGAYSDILPVFKNDVIQINYTLAGTLNAFRFIYAKGSESEVS